MEEIKVIFLDVDGVLNNENHILKLVELLGKEQYFQLHKDLGEMPFDYQSCILLHGLINKTGAEVILSSTWRISTEHIEALEKFAGIKIKDKTPVSYTKRGREIQQYLNAHNEITNYVIIDDDDDMLEEQKSHFVKVDAKTGLTMAEVVECERILSL